jgi:hypothetical protein
MAIIFGQFEDRLFDRVSYISLTHIEKKKNKKKKKREANKIEH